MAKNDFQQRLRDREQAVFDAGERIGIQKMWDFVQIVLRDPDTMGRDVFGKGRMEKIYHKTEELADYFSKAFSKDVEADHRQEELDALLREIWGEDLVTFYDRYPEIKKFKYSKAQKGWVD